MTIPGSASPLLLRKAAAAGAYAIERSVRFNSSDSAYCSKTFASAGNRKTWTWSGWVKRSALGSNQKLFIAGTSGNEGGIQFYSGTGNDAIELYDYAGSYSTQLDTIQLFRDASAWYHIVVAYDTTQATASNRVKLYVNGTQVTAFATATYPSQNYDGFVNNNIDHAIGAISGPSGYFNGYLADLHFIDGQALTPSSFGEFDDNGIWQPIEYAGSYGTNGFHLPFDDNSTAAALGTDTSGNSNTWTVNNISVTAGAANDSVVDVPTNGTETDTGVGGEVRGNYAVLNPLSLSGTLSNGNLDLSTTTVNAQPSTFFLSSGKWYWETTIFSNGGSDAYIRAGVCNQAGVGQSLGATANGWCFLGDGRVYYNGSASSYGVSITTGDVLNIALDIDAGKLWYGKNGTWMASGNPATGANPSQTFTAGTALSPAYAAGGGTVVFNFNAGQRAFSSTAPSGFKALCTANLPGPVVTKPSEYMDIALYTGNYSTNIISGLGFSPGLVWIKNRNSGGASHFLADVIRGGTKVLQSNSTAAEATRSDHIQSFNADGFTLGPDGTSNYPVNDPFVAWTWDAGSSTVTNTQGSITSTVSVRANATAGFSIVTYAGTGVASTVGHGLGAVPGLIIIKDRTSGAYNWQVYHSTFAGTSNTIVLNSTAAVDTGGSSVWNSTTPTSTVFSIGTAVGVNTNGNNYVAYCFAPVAGYSSFGSYTGNGSADGPFVYTGHRSRWIMVKRSDSAGNWYIFDTARSTFNVVDDYLLPNSSVGEGTFTFADILSNGFKIRDTSNDWNANGGTILYASFAENPFQYARAR